MTTESRHLQTNQPPRCGFAAIFSISLIILVGSTLAVLAGYFAMEAQRTRSAAEEAQLRQLLTAGALAAVHDADAGKSDVALTLPAELNGAKVSIHLTGDGDARRAEITAMLAERQMSETLSLQRANGKWSVVSAMLDDDDHPPAATQPSDRSTAASQRS